MTWTDQLDTCSCVLLRLGERRFALAADQVAELAAPSRIFRFAQRTPQIDGVILRRGRVIPVCDIAEQLVGKKLTQRRFYLIAVRRQREGLDWVALPVSGACELIQADLTPASVSDSPHVAGWLSFQGDVIEVLNLYALTPGISDPQSKTSAAAAPPEVHA
jgi:chemotaxis signal transduction protein